MSEEQVYRCKKCKKLTKDKNDKLKELCASCKLKDLKTKSTICKLEKYNKFELNQEIKTLTQKMGDVTDSEDFSDNISTMDDIVRMKTSSQQHLKTKHLKQDRYYFEHQRRTKAMGSLAKRKVKRHS